jgi:hypothetical protein
MNAGNNFTMSLMGQTGLPSLIRLGSNSTFLTTLSDNGLIETVNVVANRVSALEVNAHTNESIFSRMFANGTVTASHLVQAQNMAVG